MMNRSPLKALESGFGRRLPVILQAEAAECGQACLAMILGYYGHSIDLATFRRRVSISLKGVTLRDLISTAETMGLVARAVRVDLDELSALKRPAVLHWRLNHFVVLASISKDHVVIHDPAVGRRTITKAELSESFTGVALELTPSEGFEIKDERNVLRLRDLFRHVHGLKPALLALFVLSLGLEIIALVSPMVSQVVIDEVIVTADHDLLVTITCGLAFLLVLQMGIGTVRSWFVALFSTRVALQWNASLFSHLSRLPLDYFAKRHTGDIISRFGSLGAVQKTLTTDMVQTLMDGIMAIGMGIMLFLYGGWLGAIACIALVLDIGCRMMSYSAYRRASEEALVFDARGQSHFIETISNMATIKLLDLRERRQEGWLNTQVDSMNIRLKLQRYDIVFGRLNDLIFGADRLIMMVLGARAVMSGSMTVGMLVAFLSYKDQFASRVGSLVGTAFKLRMLNVQTERLSDIVMSEPEASTTRQGHPVIDAEPVQLSCNGLSLRYASQDPWVIRNFSMSFPVGKTIAIIGPSGCGKTTLLRALMGLSRPEEGQVLMNGQDISRKEGSDYRSRIAGVLQDDGLFSGSLGENISGFAENPDWSRIEACAAQAAVLEDIRRMPMQFETLIGEMGNSLSGGQKQRIILARALYRQPEILFLDEATSHLDDVTEQVVATALKETRMTKIIIAHRPATINSADLVIRMSPGKGIEIFEIKQELQDQE